MHTKDYDIEINKNESLKYMLAHNFQTTAAIRMIIFLCLAIVLPGQDRKVKQNLYVQEKKL